MKQYELTLVIDAKASAAKKKKVKDSVEKMLTIYKGKTDKMEDWGVKEAGAYLFFPLVLEPEAAKEFKVKLAQEKDIVKHLLIRKEE